MSDLKMKTYVVSMVETNCYLVYRESTGEAVFVDPGDDATYLKDAVRELGVTPKAILLTHGHFDHIMATEELKKEYQIPVYAWEREKELLEDGKLNMTASYLHRSFTVSPDILLKDGESFELLGFTWKLLGTPGHTGGSACFYIPSEKVLFSGDTLFQESYGRVDFPTSSSEAMIHSIVEVLFELPDDVTVYPGHMGATTMAHEKSHNPLSIVYKGRNQR